MVSPMRSAGLLPDKLAKRHAYSTGTASAQTQRYTVENDTFANIATAALPPAIRMATFTMPSGVGKYLFTGFDIRNY